MSSNKINVDEFEKSTECYFNDIASFKPLTKEEEFELWKRYSENHNDTEARDLILKANLKFVAKIAKQYRGRGLSYGDLIAEGNMGLLRAMEKFDYTMGYKTISYSVWWIRQSILEALNSRNNIKDEDLPMDYEKQDAGEALDDNPDYSIENSKALFDEGESEEENIKELVQNLLQHLNDRECELLCEYYGINGSKPMTLDEIGKLHGITKERVRQISEKSKKILRSLLLEKKIDNPIY